MIDPKAGAILCFNKPYALTSFRVVSRVRGVLNRLLGCKNLKVGHAGTLDPLATGVLIVCTGKSTKLIDQLQAGVKEYVAKIRLGATTPSFDMETAEDAQFPTDHLSRALIEQTLARFVGTIEQIPPHFSAVKVNGKRAFKLARKGETPELQPKTLVIDEIELLACDLTPRPEGSLPPTPVSIKHPDPALLPGLHAAALALTPSITVRIRCSKGTYIRALARDIGEALGCRGYLTDLQRTQVGEFTLANCQEIDDFEAWAEQNVSVSAENNSISAENN